MVCIGAKRALAYPDFAADILSGEGNVFAVVSKECFEAVIVPA